MGKKPMPKTQIDRAYVRAHRFSTAAQQIAGLLGYGARERTIYVQGRGPENLAAIVKAARRGEVIGLWGGYRVLGDSRKEIMEGIRALKAKGAIIFDPESDERSDRHGEEMLDRALRRINGEATLGSPERAAELGALGAKASHKAVWDVRMPIARARKIWFDKTISRNEAERRMGPGWSKSTALRKFKKAGRRKGPAKVKE
jgi:hypothetical protein